MIDPDKIEYEYIVLSIPKESVYLEVNASLLDNGSVITLSTKMNPSDIREAANDYEKTVDGELPLYTLTEKGREYLASLENK